MEPKNQIETRIIQELTANFKLSDILKVTKFPKSTYHYWVKKMAQENPDQELENLILSIFKENDENYGYRRITDELHHRGHRVNHKKVYRLMKKRGIICVNIVRIKELLEQWLRIELTADLIPLIRIRN